MNTQAIHIEVPNRGLIIINESGLYSLILSSKLPKAREFKRWVTSEVLPALRKHGRYISPVAAPFVPSSSSTTDLISLLKAQIATQDKLIKLLEQQGGAYHMLKTKIATYTKDDLINDINSPKRGEVFLLH